MLNQFKPLAGTAMGSVFLAACGGGGGSSSNDTNTERSPVFDPIGITTTQVDPGLRGANVTPETIQALTAAAPPAETAAQQDARSRRILSRADLIFTSGGYGEPSRGGRTARAQASCSGTSCSIREDSYGISETVGLSNLEFATAASEPVATKHGVTLLRLTTSDLTGYGSWMDHSGFLAQADWGLPVGGVPANLRWNMAGGKLTRYRPIQSLGWKGLMVGTIAEGRYKGNRLQGDATLTFDMNSATLDVRFNRIRNVDFGGLEPGPFGFDDVPVSSTGTFRSGSGKNQIQGGFFGPNHAEATGGFEARNIIGAFGAKKSSDE